MGLTIKQAIRKAKENKKGAFIPYFILGYPDIDISCSIIRESSKYADVIELGIPFTDPVADGPIIQQGAAYALEKGITLTKIFKATKKLTSEIDIPFVYMIYFNQIFAYGLNRFLKKIKDIGIKGLIIPDLLPDSDVAFNKLAYDYGIDIIFLITPATSESRITKIIKECRGFLYFVSIIGITGERIKFNDSIRPMINSLREKTNLPICIGFGISTPKHIKEVVELADGAIVGSAITKSIMENINGGNLVYNVVRVIENMNSVL